MPKEKSRMQGDNLSMVREVWNGEMWISIFDDSVFIMSVRAAQVEPMVTMLRNTKKGILS